MQDVANVRPHAAKPLANPIAKNTSHVHRATAATTPVLHVHRDSSDTDSKGVRSRGIYKHALFIYRPLKRDWKRLL